METGQEDKWGLRHPRMQRFLELWERAWANPGGGELADFWTDDAVVHVTEGNAVSGADIAGYVVKFLELAPDLASRPLAAGESGRTLFVHFRIGGTFAGKRFEWDGVDRLDFRPGEERAYRAETFYDPQVVRDAIAHVEAAHAAERS